MLSSPRLCVDAAPCQVSIRFKYDVVAVAMVYVYGFGRVCASLGGEWLDPAAKTGDRPGTPEQDLSVV